MSAERVLRRQASSQSTEQQLDLQHCIGKDKYVMVSTYNGSITVRISKAHKRDDDTAYTKKEDGITKGLFTYDKLVVAVPQMDKLLAAKQSGIVNLVADYVAHVQCNAQGEKRFVIRSEKDPEKRITLSYEEYRAWVEKIPAIEVTISEHKARLEETTPADKADMDDEAFLNKPKKSRK